MASATASFGVLWDMDGVLIDTGELHFRSWKQALAEIGYPYTQEEFRRHFGMNNTSILSLVIGHPTAPEEVERVDGRKEDLFREWIRGNAQPLPGVVAWLKRLHASGVPMAVASSAPQANVDLIIGELEIGPYFTALVSGYSLAGKPDPATFLEAANRIGMPPGRCLVIEDSLAGLEAAQRARMRCIAVTTTNPASALVAADLVVDSLDQLPADAFSRWF